MRPRLVPVVLLTLLAAGCGSDAPAADPAPEPTGDLPADTDAARGELAARAALAQDHRYAALYDFDPGDGQGTRSVVATVATDGTWRVDVPGGALGGTTDVSIVQVGDGVYQCAMPSATNPVNPSCVRVAEPNKQLPKEYDPKVQRVFRQWLSVFQDRQAPLSVVAAQPLSNQGPAAQGKCYAVDGISASLKPPVDVGIYCYADNGQLTAARVDFGTLTLVSVAAAPPRIDLPGPISGGEAMGMKSPPPPPPPPAVDPSNGPTSPGAQPQG
ncbi:hypothetical protein [Actinoplanes sp. NBRC 103695]|uniref:hypothetical protein n=1 Tax=Actinoplanes sp. NBRC 103695 TaxID=3032202 RepID=UPI0024A5B9E1|nr:hypothetical protein [Actinoplanes sp. NBRC 103695]GLY97122.1 hypothetical protein Acsp02_43760 [Actinoplanes sp. NBRC 103695]